MAHDETGQSVVGQIIRELPVAILKIRVAYVRLVPLKTAAKPKRVVAYGPRRLIADLTSVADEPAIREIADTKISTRNAEPPNPSFGFGKLLDIGAEIIKLRHVPALRAVRRIALQANNSVIHKTRIGNPGVAGGVVLALHNRSRAICQQILSIIGRHRLIAVQIKSRKKFILPPAHHLIETGDAFVLVLVVGKSISDPAV